MRIDQRIKVEFQYMIHFTHDIFDPGNNVLGEVLREEHSKVIIFLDSGVVSSWPDIQHSMKRWFDAHPRYADIIFPSIIVNGGERCKNDFPCQKEIANALRINGLDRHSYVIIIGGGAVLDAVGFITSISQRGIRHIRIPTTVLSQNDSGVGVKNGVNFFGVKNYFGTFTPPYAVINDFDFLKTLNMRDWLSGVSEAFKVAIIKDRSFLEYLACNAKALFMRNEKVMEELIFRCVRLHTDHIAFGNDPFENGSSRPLDFGHWSGHYLEAMTGYELRHGEAVAIGIVLDITIAKNRGLISQGEYNLVFRSLNDCGFRLWHPFLEKRSNGKSLDIYNGLEEFRQHLGGKLTLIMPEHLGSSCQIHSISHDEVERAVEEMKDVCIL